MRMWDKDQIEGWIQKVIDNGSLCYNQKHSSPKEMPLYAEALRHVFSAAAQANSLGSLAGTMLMCVAENL